MYSPKRRFRLFRSPAFAGFNPALYGTLALWVDAADVAGTGVNPSDGSVVTTWADKSGGGRTATKVGNPTLSATGVNGKPGISLDGSSMGYRGAVSTTGTVLTTFVVATLNSGTPVNGRLLSLTGATGVDYDNAGYIIPLLRNASGQEVATFYNGSARSVSSVPAYDTPFYATAVVDGTTNTTFVNGIAGTASAMSPTFAITKYAIGLQPNSDGDYWKGYVSEVLIYTSALSSTNRLAVEAYLATKWGI